MLSPARFMSCPFIYVIILVCVSIPYRGLSNENLFFSHSVAQYTKLLTAQVWRHIELQRKHVGGELGELEIYCMANQSYQCCHSVAQCVPLYISASAAQLPTQLSISPLYRSPSISLSLILSLFVFQYPCRYCVTHHWILHNHFNECLHISPCNAYITA